MSLPSVRGITIIAHLNYNDGANNDQYYDSWSGLKLIVPSVSAVSSDSWTPRTVGTLILILVTFFSAICVSLIFCTYQATRWSLEAKTRRSQERHVDERQLCRHRVFSRTPVFSEISSNISSGQAEGSRKHLDLHYEVDFASSFLVSCERVWPEMKRIPLRPTGVGKSTRLDRVFLLSNQ